MHAELGNSPWTVFGQGIAEHTALKIGTATILVSFCVILAWIPLRVRPGFGTIANAIVVGIGIDVMEPLLGERGPLVARVVFVFAGVGLIALGSGLYLTANFGAGPRDGLMTGLSLRTGHSLRFWRTIIELCALAAGFALGGTIGFGTVAFAVLIGPGVQLAVGRFSRERSG